MPTSAMISYRHSVNVLINSPGTFLVNILNRHGYQLLLMSHLVANNTVAVMFQLNALYKRH